MGTDFASTAAGTLPRTEAVIAPTIGVEVGDVGRRDHVRWGPVVAGIVTAFAILLFLTVVGVALGLSALGSGDDPRSWGTAAGIWGGLTLLVAFFLGGWMAARTAAPAFDPDGIINGFVTGAATLLLLLWLATTAVTGALGFFVGTIGDIAGVAAPVAADVAQTTSPPAAQQAENAVNQASEEIQQAAPDNPQQAAAAATEVARERVGPGAWGTAIAMILAVGVATLGGKVGQDQRRALVSRAVVTTR